MERGLTAASAMVDPVAGGRTFERVMRPALADCAPSGRLRLDAIARWLQDIAYADVEDAGLHFAAVWVVRRTRIRVRRFPRFADTVAVQTFCSGVGRMWAERRTTLRGTDGAAAVEAAALWVHLDPASRRPSPFSAAELETYGGAGGGRRVTARLHHPGAEPGATRSSWTFRPTELDLADHVNNAAYWQPLEAELLSAPEPAGCDVEIEFRAPAQPGPVEVLAAGRFRWLVDRHGATIASALIADPAPGG